MPLPTKKLKVLAEEEPNIPPKVDIISKRRKSTSALFVAVYNGKPQSPTFKTSDEVLEYMNKNHMPNQYNIQKLHTTGDRDLITKINKKYNV